MLGPNLMWNKTIILITYQYFPGVCSTKRSTSLRTAVNGLAHIPLYHYNGRFGLYRVLTFKYCLHEKGSKGALCDKKVYCPVANWVRLYLTLRYNKAEKSETPCVVKFGAVAWNDPGLEHAARSFLPTGEWRGSPAWGPLQPPLRNIQLHAVKPRCKVRMVQKILNKVVGAKYITILRTW